MAGRHLWFVNGAALDGNVTAQLTPEQQWQLMNREGAVRLTAGDLGTEIKWVVASPHLSSLFVAEALLEESDGPFVLRFYSAGWFEERFACVKDVHVRIAGLVMHADRHIISRVFERSATPDAARTPAIVRHVLNDQRPPPDHSIECCFDANQDGFVVRRVGERSTIGRIWGTDPTSYPCQTTGAFGNSASSAYKRALEAREPVYEQVVAALRFPDTSLHWVSYHRVILPMVSRRGDQSVAVVSEYGDVDFCVL